MKNYLEEISGVREASGQTDLTGIFAEDGSGWLDITGLRVGFFWLK